MDRDEKRQRLFFALWPDEGVRRALEQAAKKTLGKRVKRIAAHNLHITLAFAGAVSAQQRSCLEAAADAIHGSCFEVCIDRLGHWARPRILWAGTRNIPTELRSLAAELQQALAGCGLEVDTRAFHPHVTLARKQSRAPRGDEFPAIAWSISQFSLIESVTDPTGVRYCVLRSWTLGSG
ncbi:MAG: RNA 2',3'-cyclic phosphodiesterase [Gammaproteobacteria bacterium]